MNGDRRKRIEVVFALPGRCWRVSVDVAACATAAEVAEASGLVEMCREQTGKWPSAYGVFGRKVAEDYVVTTGERLELYRPLTADPRERRRQRVAGGG